MRTFLDIEDCSFSPFITLNKSYHSHLVCRVSAEKSTGSHKGVPLYVICCFSLAVFSSPYFNFGYFVYSVSRVLHFLELVTVSPGYGGFQLSSLQVFSLTPFLSLLLLGLI